MRTNTLTLFSLFIVATILFGCKKQDWNVTIQSQVQFKASTDEITIAGKQFVMDEIRIDLSDIRIAGDRIQSNPIDIVLADNASTDFLHATSVKPFDLPIGTYPQMSFSTTIESNGSPSVNISGTYDLANGNTYDVVIALEIDQDIITLLTDSDGSNTILIEEDSQKTIAITLDTEILFSDLIPGLWNAAAVTNNNGSQTIQVDALNNTNIYNAINNKVGESFVVQLQ